MNNNIKYKKLDVDGHSVLLVDIRGCDDLLAKAEEQARLKAEHVQKNDPAGNRRNSKELLSQNFLGVLADMVCAEILNRYFEKYGIKIQVERYDDVRTDNFENHDLYDIRLKSTRHEKDIEIRSSACLLLSMEKMVNKWQILGPYVSDAKGDTETYKPFYMRILYHFADFERNRKEHFYSRSNGIDHIKSGDLEIYYVGGATAELLQSKKGRNEDGDELKQGKAKFRVLDITDGLDAANFLDVIVKNFSE